MSAPLKSKLELEDMAEQREPSKTPPEVAGRANPDSQMTMACAIGKHKLCDGHGTLDDGETPFDCKCFCHPLGDA